MPPRLIIDGESASFLKPGASPSFLCIAPLRNVHYQLRQGEEVLGVPSGSTSLGDAYFDLKSVALGDGGLYTCRYQLRDQQAWSSDSAPVELLLSDGKPGGPGVNNTPGARRPTASHSLQGRSGSGKRDLGKGPPVLEGSGWGPIPTPPPGLSFAN